MKILCLHGRDQSGQIFETQLGAIIRVFQSTETKVSFEFVDAPIQCVGPSPNGRPRYKFYDASVLDAFTTTGICMAHEWLAKKLTADGPYDGVIGFSQGATLISSYLLYHQWYGYDDSTPFNFAIFISGSLPLAVLKDLGVYVPTKAERVVEETVVRRQAGQGPLLPHVSLARQAMFNSDDCFGLNLNRIPLELKVRIPTAHIWGVDDPAFPTSIHLAGICDPYIRKIYTHNGAHEVPQATVDAQEVSQLLLWCMQRATWPGQSSA
ncbi:serine hydrolase FSH [Xylaria venustula]|nr:serine hydrolase FSH [Xylaria venustula]